MKKQVKNSIVTLLMSIHIAVGYANMPCIYAYNGCVRLADRNKSECLDSIWSFFFAWASVECEIEWDNNMDGCGETYVACVEGG